MNLLLASSDPLSHVVPHALHDEPLFRTNIGGGDIPALNIYSGWYEFFITNHLVMTAVSAVAVVLVFAFVASRVRVKGDGLRAYETRGRVAQVFETMCTFIRDEVVRPNLHQLTDKYIFYIWTIFFFVLFANVLGLDTDWTDHVLFHRRSASSALRRDRHRQSVAQRHFGDWQLYRDSVHRHQRNRTKNISGCTSIRSAGTIPRCW